MKNAYFSLEWLSSPLLLIPSVILNFSYSRKNEIYSLLLQHHFNIYFQKRKGTLKKTCLTGKTPGFTILGVSN